VSHPKMRNKRKRKREGEGEGAPDHCKSHVDQSIEQRAVLTLSFKCLGLKSLDKIL